MTKSTLYRGDDGEKAYNEEEPDSQSTAGDERITSTRPVNTTSAEIDEGQVRMMMMMMVVVVVMMMMMMRVMMTIIIMMTIVML